MKRGRKPKKKSEEIEIKKQEESQTPEEGKEIKDDKEKTKQLPKELQLALKKIKKTFGEESIGFANKEKLTITRIPSGIKLLDEAMGGGFPRGMITEIFGPESGGKGTIVGTTIANAQRNNLICDYTDAEHALEEVWMKKLGVDYDQLLHSEVTDVNKIFDMMKDLLISKSIDLLVVDSVAALTYPKEMEDEMGKAQMATLAKQMNKGLRVSNALNSRQGTAIIYINQVRDTMTMYGPPSTTPGGKGMRFFARIRIEVKAGEWYPDRKKSIAREIICRIIKNATSEPEKEARFYLVRATGQILELNEIKKLYPQKEKEKEKEEE